MMTVLVELSTFISADRSTLWSFARAVNLIFPFSFVETTHPGTSVTFQFVLDRISTVFVSPLYGKVRFSTDGTSISGAFSFLTTTVLVLPPILTTTSQERSVLFSLASQTIYILPFSFFILHHPKLLSLTKAVQEPFPSTVMTSCPPW